MEQKDQYILKGNFETFLTLPRERLVFAQRQHWFVLIVPILGTIFISILCFITIFFLSIIHFYSFFLLITGSLLLLTLTISAITKLTMEWYFHFYLVTNRKILQITYKPFINDKINELLLDQVKCTEVDVNVNGILNETIDMGDVTITFDRPTHEEEFTFSHMQSPRQIGLFLADAFDTHPEENTNIIWYHQKTKESRWRFTEQIFPKTPAGIII